MRKLLPLIAVVAVLLTGCKSDDALGAKINDIDFTIISPNDIQQEIKELVEERQSKPFKLTYSDGDYLYIVVGYGEQTTGGYSITVGELYLAGNGIHVETNLVGPSKDDVPGEAPSYPYIVIKIENIDKVVLFN